MKSMLEQSTEDDDVWGSYTSEDQGKLLREIRQALKDKSYLIVMDDVWNTENGFGWWEQIPRELPNEEKHSCCIIITTRNEQVAKSMGVVENRIHRPKILDIDESWSLFCKIAFNSPKGGECKVHVGLQKVGMDIVEICGGLPLAIKTIGGLPSTKPKYISDWENIRDEFHDKNLTNNGNCSSILTSIPKTTS